MLKRQLGLWQTVILGLGIMIGAGIYSLVGVAGIEAGDALWLSFAFASVLAILAALSYSELSSMFPNAGSSYFYSKQAFGSRKLSFLMGWFLIVAYTAASTVVALGFAQYFHSLVPLPQQLIAVSLILFLGLLNYIGMKVVSRFETFATLLSICGLLAVIGLFFASTGFGGLHFSLESPKGLSGLMSASIIVFFAYLGFEALATMAEEVKDVRRNLPRAIIFSIVLTSLIYILIAFAFTSALPYEKLVQTVSTGKGALAVAAGELGGEGFLFALGIIALFATSTTVMVTLIGCSRMMYGMAEDAALPRQLMNTTSSGVPGLTIIIATLLSAALVFLGDISFLARTAVSGMFIVFIVDNLSVIALRFEKPHMARPFRIPFSIGPMPITPIITLLFLLGLLLYDFMSDPLMPLSFLALAVVGLIVNEGEYRLTGD